MNSGVKAFAKEISYQVLGNLKYSLGLEIGRSSPCKPTNWPIDPNAKLNNILWEIQ